MGNRSLSVETLIPSNILDVALIGLADYHLRSGRSQCPVFYGADVPAAWSYVLSRHPIINWGMIYSEVLVPLAARGRSVRVRIHDGRYGFGNYLRSPLRRSIEVPSEEMTPEFIFGDDRA
jgi:hypothetical protein